MRTLSSAQTRARARKEHQLVFVLPVASWPRSRNDNVFIFQRLMLFDIYMFLEGKLVHGCVHSNGKSELRVMPGGGATENSYKMSSH